MGRFDEHRDRLRACLGELAEGGAYDLDPVVLESNLTINDNLRSGGNHNQDTERAAVKAAEEEFMEREMKALQKRYEAEKVKIRAQMVAEPGERW